MTYVNAISNKWNIKNDIKFKTVNDIIGGVSALSKGTADYFYGNLQQNHILIIKSSDH